MEKQQFKAESKRLLDLMINSIYTNREIFLREIISNASDAIDKLAYTALTDENVGLSRSDFAITITRDEENRTITVSDNGIGMNRAEMEETWAPSPNPAPWALSSRWNSRRTSTLSDSSAWASTLPLWWLLLLL